MEDFSANHSAEPEVTETTAIPSAPETVNTPTEPSGITVKFNHEERVIGLDEAPAWIQKGLNYDKVSERAQQADQYAKNLDRVAKFNGYDSSDEFLQALEQAEINEQAQKAGVDPAMYRQQTELTTKVSSLEQKLQSYEMKDIRYAQDEKLSSDPNTGELYKQYRDEVKQLAESANTDYDIAFTLLLREKLPTLLTGMKSQAEQETIRKLQQNESTSTGSLAIGDSSHKTSIGQMGKEDFGSMVQQVLRGERKTL